MTTRSKLLVLACCCIAAPFSASAQVVIDEIMYNPSGNDTGNEWVELYNEGPQDVTMTAGSSGWRFNDGSNHLLVDPASGTGRGTLSIPAGGYAVLSNDPDLFLATYPNGSYPVIKSAFSLNNTGATLTLLDDSGATVDSVSYTKDTGGNGDGNSLQLVSGSWVAAAPTPGAANQSVPVTSGSDSNSSGSSTSGSSTPPPPPSSDASSFPTEPQIFARITGPSAAIAGADVTFTGQGWGLQSEPLADARYVWSFGDGASREGEAVDHVFFLPGTYVVVLDVSSGKYDASSRQTVTVSAPSFTIAAPVSGTGGYLALSNGAASDVDLSHWWLSAGGAKFELPANTIILSGGTLKFANQVTGLSPDGFAQLLFPNGTVAASYPPPSAPPKQNAPVVATAAAAPVPKPKPVAAPSPTPSSSSRPPSSLAAVATAQTPVQVNATTSTSSDAQGQGGGTNTLLWYSLLGGVVLVGAGAYFLAGRRERDTFKILEEKDEEI